jgi:hypothetical protein
MDDIHNSETLFRDAKAIQSDPQNILFSTIEPIIENEPQILAIEPDILICTGIEAIDNKESEDHHQPISVQNVEFIVADKVICRCVFFFRV